MGDTSNSEPAHAIGTRKGEEISKDEGKEAGREKKGSSHASRRARCKGFNWSKSGRR